MLLDLPRYFGVDWCEPGHGVTTDDLRACADKQGVEIRRGDIALLRFGQIAQARAAGDWGDFAGGDAPGLTFDTLDWVAETEIAGLASDTWGV